MKFRESFIGNTNLIITLVIAFSLVNLFGLFSDSYIVEFLSNFSADLIEVNNMIVLDRIMSFIEPIILLAVIYIVLKSLAINNLVLLSFLVTTVVTVLITVIKSLLLNYISLESVFTLFVSIFVLTYTWFIFVQVIEDKISAFTSGYLSYLIIIEVIYFIRTIIIDGSFPILSFLGSLCIASIISVVFSAVLKMFFKIFGLNKKSANTR